MNRSVANGFIGQLLDCYTLAVLRAFKPGMAARTAMRALRTCAAALILSVALSSGPAAASDSGPNRSPAAGETVTPQPQIRELMALLADPKVRDWLEQQRLA